jgi:hypothetical protein
MRLRIAKIEARSAERPAGYVEAVLSRGVIDGEWLEISPEALAELRATYRPASQPAPEPTRPRHGLGDLVAMVATPIARALRLPCIDPATKDLRPGSPCARRKAWLNGAPANGGPGA